MGVSVVVAAGWWVAAVALTPAADRPYVGGSQNNSILNLIFGYNGFGRLTGNETGSVGGGPVAGSMWGPTGFTRLFNSTFGNMMSWLLPGALVMGAVLLVLTLRARRTDRERAGLLLWGGSLVSAGLVISLAQGIIHPYYAVALAPPLGALVGHRHHGAVGTPSQLGRPDRPGGRLGGHCRLERTCSSGAPRIGSRHCVPSWQWWARWASSPSWRCPCSAPCRSWPLRSSRRSGLGAALVAPLFSTVATAATPHGGAIPSVTPTPAGGQGGPGGTFPGGAFRGGGFRGGGFHRAFGGSVPGGGFPGGTFPGGGFPAGGFPGGGVPGGSSTGNGNTTSPGFAGGAPSFGGARFGRGFGGGAPGGGGFLNASQSNPALTKLLQADAEPLHLGGARR